MKVIDYPQGSPEWLAHRGNPAIFNASDAPAMMNCSSYKTRAQMLRERATGLGEEVTPEKQRLFDSGHRFEALARPLAEQIIGEPLYPVVGVEGPYSASFDGITLCEDVAFEHKRLNDTLRECMEGWDESNCLPLQYRVQMEHQLMVSGADKVLFMASDWTRDDMLNEERHCWYYPDLVLRSQIIAGWAQFAEDLAAYEPPADVAPAPTGKAPETLPALRIEVTGMVTASNLAEFKETALAAIRSVNRELSTDADFANAESAVKWCGEVESRLSAAKDHALSQTASIDALFRTIDDISAEARKVRLDLEKLVKARKESIRGEIVAGAAAAFAAHVRQVNATLTKVQLPPVNADFGGVIKGKRTVASLRDAVDTELARVKIAVNELADRARVSLAMLDQHADKAFLFNDFSNLVMKAPDDLAAIITNRIAEHARKEAARLDAERERIRVEEQAKAQREAAALAAAEAQRLAAQQQAEQRAAAQKLADERAAFERQQAEAAAIVAPGSLRDKAYPQVSGVVVDVEFHPTSTVTTPSPVDEPPTLKLGTICERLSFTVSADFMVTLGYRPVVDKGACLFHESDFANICQAISAHVLEVAHQHAG